MGPVELAGDSSLPNRSVGRVDAIAFDPSDSSRIYVAPYRGGLWKTVSGGQTWRPLTDGLPTLLRGAVAVDPKIPNVIYYGTGYYMGGEEGKGIFKSIDGGMTWSHFIGKVDLPALGPTPFRVVERLVVRHTPSGVLIYAATNLGVLRYQGVNPFDLASRPDEWTLIKPGRIWDMAVNPDDNSEVYASMFLHPDAPDQTKGGLWRTTKGETATSNSDWTEVLQRPAGNRGHFGFDIHWDSPKTVWASLDKPGSVCDGKLAVYKSMENVNHGDFIQRYCFDLEGFVEFIRVRPDDPNWIYFGGVNLYWCRGNCGNGWRVKRVHADQKELQFHPDDPEIFWVTNDGGVFRCRWQQTSPGSIGWDHACVPRNRNLRVTQFYDFDTSLTDSALMIGGTQDNGTIMFPGDANDPDLWKNIKGGDGNYSVIAPDNMNFYAQHQRLNDTRRCKYGKHCEPGKWIKAWLGLPDQAGALAQIAADPVDSGVAYGIGPQVHQTTDYGYYWPGVGPTAADGLSADSSITRIVIHPQRVIFAGTSKGEIWAKGPSFPWTQLPLWPWQGFLKHGVKSLALSPVDPNYLYVMFSAPDTTLTKLSMFRLHFDPATLSLDVIPISQNFPAETRRPRVIAGDGHQVDVAYVGTDKGIFKGTATCPGCPWAWSDYSDGLPLVEIYDLLVDPTSKELRAASFGRGAWRVMTGP
jgi:hypothetical protein